MKFNPEDDLVGGPRCRNCHKGSSGCGTCHSALAGVISTDTATAPSKAANNSRADISYFFSMMMEPPGNANYKGPFTTYKMTTTSDDQTNTIALNMGLGDVYGAATKSKLVKNSRSVTWTQTWRTVDGATKTCSDDGLSWPHRTLGWKMLKDDMFGIDVVGRTDGQSTVVGEGVMRQLSGLKDPAGNQLAASTTHGLDSVCLDCHNPTVWRATSGQNHSDTPETTADDYNDDTLLRGLP